MTAVELRKILIDRIHQTEDEHLLGEACRLLDAGTGETDVYQLSEHQKEAVRQARKEINEGQFLNDEQANAEIDEWLEK